jgi:hypothetical protein
MPLGGSACYTRPKVARPSLRDPNELENHNRKTRAGGAGLHPRKSAARGLLHGREVKRRLELTSRIHGSCR